MHLDEDFCIPHKEVAEIVEHKMKFDFSKASVSLYYFYDKIC